MNNASEREFYRIAAEVPVLYGPDLPEGRRAMAMDHDLWQTQSELESAARLVLGEGKVEDAQRPILNVLRWLDFKLDLLLYHLRSRELSAVFPRFAQSLDLSGSGVSLREAPDLNQGDRILLSLTLPNAPSRPIFAVGEVVRVEPPAGAGERRVAVRFSVIDGVVKPVIAAAIMGAFAFLFNAWLLPVAGKWVALGAGIVGGVVAYATLILILGGIRAEDLDMLPGGSRLRRFVKPRE